MKGMLKFLRKVMKNEEGLYDKEKNIVSENMVFTVMMLILCVMLITPWGRWIIKWIAYISAGFMVLATIAVLYNNHRTLKNACKHAQKLEKMGTSYEEMEKARRKLCEMEGDDGFEPASTHFCRRVVYFADHGALNHYADALYGCYLAQSFQPKYMKLPENAVVYTTGQELKKLCKLESEAVDKTAPYLGYTSFIRASCKVVEPYSQSNDENLVATILKIQKDENVSVVLLSTNESLKEIAELHNVSVINPAQGEMSDGESAEE